MSNLYHALCRESFQFLAATLFQKLTFRFSTTSAALKIDYGGFGGSPAALSGCLPSQGKWPPLRLGWLSFCSGLCFVCFCLLRFAYPLSLFAFQQLKPTFSFFLSVTPFFVDCCLLLGPSVFGVPWCWVPPLCKPIPQRRPRRCSHSPVRASAVLPFLGIGLPLGSAPIPRPRPRPRQCSNSLAPASAMLPFLGVALGGSSVSA
jgi:hypothetical protein